MDVDDLAMTVTGMISFPSVSGVTGGPTTYTVTVNTGDGNGTFLLNVPTSATFSDMIGKPLDSLVYTGGETHTITKGFAIFLQLILR